MEISVVIPSYNSQESLPSTLRSLEGQQAELTFEVIVVDCSEGEEVAQVCESFPAVTLVRRSERFNPGIGRNLGAQSAEGQALLFLDADVLLDSRALQNAWDYFNKGHAVFGGALELNEARGNNVASFLEHFFFNHESQKGRPQCARTNLSSALMFIDRKVFLGGGGFKDIPRMQDTEMTERLRREEHSLSFNPDVLGLQTQDSPLAQVLRKIHINGRNLYFIRYAKKPLSYRLLLGAFLPGLTFLKMGRIVARHLRYQDPRKRLITLLLVPHLTLSGVYWMTGVYRSMLFGGGISRKRG